MEQSTKTLKEASDSAMPIPHAMPSLPDLTLLREIGRGAYGEVWLAHTLTGHLRAVKIVHPHPEDANAVKREFDGVKTCQDIARNSPGLLEILHVGRMPDGGFYYVMPAADDFGGKPGRDIAAYVPHTLRAEIKSGRRLSPARVQSIGVRLAAALAALHKNNVLHRDIKPANIVVIGGEPFLADIGLIRREEESMTMAGTAGYMPPEGTGTKSSDIYSLGMVIYEMLTGNTPAGFPALHESTAKQTPEDQAYIRRINDVILKACAQLPKNRFASADDLKQALGKTSPESKPAPPGPGKIIAIISIVAFALIGLFAWSPWSRSGAVPPPQPASGGGTAPLQTTTPPSFARDTFAFILTSPEYEWATPENLGPTVNSEMKDMNITISDDGLVMVMAAGSTDSNTFGLYECRRASTNDAFGPKMAIRNPSALYPAGDPFLSGDGLALLYAARQGPQQRGGFNIYETRRDNLDSPWREPVNLSSSGWESQPWLSRDGLIMLFAADRPNNGRGGLDIWRRHRTSKNSPWQEPENMGVPINTPGQDMHPCLAADDRSILFTRSDGRCDLFVAAPDAEGKMMACPLKLPMAGTFQCPCLSLDGRTLYFASDALGGFGSYDLWMTRRVHNPNAPEHSVK